MTSETPTPEHRISRRSVAAGLAWAAPAAALAVPAPAMAASPSTNNYVLRSSVYSAIGKAGAQCSNDYFHANGNQISALGLSNQVDVGTAPHGFSIVEQAKTGTATKSDSTTATLASPVQFVIAYPQGMVDLRNGYNGFYFYNNTQANWSAPSVRQVTMTNPDGYTLDYDVFTFTWLGNRTQSTVPDYNFAGTARAQSWAGTALEGSFYVNNGGYCVVDQNSRWYYAGYYLGGTAASLGNTAGTMGTFTTANGVTSGPRPLNGNNWVFFQQYTR